MPKENAHDKFFKENFSRQSVAKAFLHEVLPEKLLVQLDLTQLQLLNNSYIDTELDESFADLVYGCQLAGQPVKIALLFEHKSYVVAYPHIQLLGYLVNSLREDIKQKRKPVLVIPIIFYHGDTRWQQKPMATYYGVVSPELLPFVPEFTYILFDLSQYPDEQINKLKDKFLATSLLLMKHRQNIDYVSQNGDQLFYWLEAVIETEEGILYICRRSLKPLAGRQLIKYSVTIPWQKNSHRFTTGWRTKPSKEVCKREFSKGYNKVGSRD